VNVVLDLVDPPERLADAYRVDVRVIVWHKEDVLKVPVSAIFRTGSGWAVFTFRNGKALRKNVEIGHRGLSEVEITKGLSTGEEIVMHPSSDMSDGARVLVSRTLRE
jgi:HlyD family secretion protein